MTTIGDRIKSIRESRGLSQAELGEAVGKVGNGKPLSQQAIAAIEKDEIKNPRRLLDIAKALNVSEAYLRFGSTPEPNAKESEYTLVEAESDDWDKSEFVLLDKLDVRVRGGHGEAGGIEVVQKRLPFLRSTLRAAGVPPEAAKLVELSGSSMEPWGFHGDVVGVNTLDRWPIKDGKIYAFRDFDMMRVKILERRPGGGLKVRSYNSEEYPPEDLTADEVRDRIEIVGRVFWRSSVDY